MMDSKSKLGEALKRRRGMDMGMMKEDCPPEAENKDQQGDPIDGTAPEVKDKPESEMGMDQGMEASAPDGDSGEQVDMGGIDIAELLKSIGPLAKLIEFLKIGKQGE